MTTTIDPAHYPKTMQTWTDHARADIDEALLEVENAAKYATDGVHRAQLAHARKSLLDAKLALRWVRP